MHCPGAFQRLGLRVEERALQPGDTLALYTDGVTEAFNEAGEDFGDERLVAALRRCRKQNADDVVSSIVAEVRQFSPREQYDDITLIVARCRRA